MKSLRLAIAASLSFSLLAACGDETDKETTDSSSPPRTLRKMDARQEQIRESVPQGPNASSEEEILAFLKGRRWAEWKPESGIRNSVRAHGPKVQTFLNDALAESLLKGNTVHPKGSVAVKVLYEEDGKTLKGYALEMKTREGVDDASAWVWYEGFAPRFTRSYYGRGLALCANCHSSGVDFVRAKAPAADESSISR